MENKEIKENPFALQIKNEEDDKFQLDLDYQNSNPFVKILLGGGITAGFGAAVMAGGIYLFAATATLDATAIAGIFTICGGAFTTGIGGLIAIPGLIGTGAYYVYKKIKSGKLKNFYEKLADVNHTEMNIEREIYLKVIQELDKFFFCGYSLYFEKYIKEPLSKSYKEVLRIIFEAKKELSLKNNKKKKIFALQDNIESISKTLNVILIGRAGVGKSTLINSILKLKDDKKAPVGVGVDPMKIDKGWPKRYPINENDSEEKGINLFDTEGIEIDNKSKNSIYSHKDTVINFVNKSYKENKTPINCIWFCLHGNKLEECEKKYIGDLVDAFSSKKNASNNKFNAKIPIIFVYTQAYQVESDNIEKMEAALNDLKSININKKGIKILDVIAEKKEGTDRRGKKFCEEEYNLEKLVEETIKCSKDGYHCIIKYLVNEHVQQSFVPLFEKIKQFYLQSFKEIIESNERPEKILEIINKKNEEFIEILYDVKENKEYSKDLKEKVDQYLKTINGLFQNIKEKKFQKLIRLFDEKSTIQEITKMFIYQEFEKKGNPEKKFDDYFEEINDYLILPMTFRKENYSLDSLFNLFYNNILNITGQELNKIMENEYLDKTNFLKDFSNSLMEEKKINWFFSN